jgi:glyoxylate reductase
MPKPRVFVTRVLFPEALDRIAAAADSEVWPDEMPPPYEVLLEKAQDCDGLLTLLSDRVDAAVLQAPRLSVVSNYAVGYDNIDIAEATRRGIFVGNTPGVLTETTADMAFVLLMAAARRVVEADAYTRAGKWRTWGPMLLLGQDIHGATLGIVGLGRIGAAVARRARGFGMRVLYHDLAPQPGIEAEAADFVSLHVPLSTDTRHLIGARELDRMKPTAVLVNTSRGPVVDQAALFEALKVCRIFAAGLDVTEPEPIDPNDPLLTLDNVVIAPHIASGSVATRTRMAEMAADNLLAGLSGKVPPHCVNPEAAST